MYDRQSRLEKAHEQTFRWIFSSSSWRKEHKCENEFLKWLHSTDQSIFWISGKAGSGKSTLMNYISNDKRLKSNLSSWTAGRKLIFASFFFFDRGRSNLQKSREGLLRSLLYQILSQLSDLVPIVLAPKRKDLKGLVDQTSASINWSWNDLNQALETFLERKPESTRIFFHVDGLDEYRILDRFDQYLEYYEDEDSAETRANADAHREIAEVFQNIGLKFGVKLCLSSRPMLRLENVFSRFPNLQLQYLTKNDITRYVNDRLGNDERLTRMTVEEPKQKQELTNEIVERASGVFLWVRLVVNLLIEGLQDGDRIGDLNRKLREIPVELKGPKGLYMSMLKDVDRKYRAQGAQLFQIVNHSRRDLTPFSLSCAEESSQIVIQTRCKRLKLETLQFHSEQMEARLKSRCGGLLEAVQMTRITNPKREVVDSLENFIHGSPVVQYLHQTAKEFMEERSAQEFLDPQRLGPVSDANISLLTSCILQLKHIVFEAGLDGMWQIISDAFYYARRAETSTGLANEALVDDLDSTVERLWDRLLRRCPSDPSSAWQKSGYHWSVWQPPMYEGRISDEGNFISIAIEKGLTLYLKAKFESGHSKIRDKRGRPLLSYAVSPGHLYEVDRGWNLAESSIVQILLDNGANPNEFYGGMSIWEAAITNKFTRSSDRWLEILGLLVMHDANINVKVQNWKENDHKGDRLVSPMFYVASLAPALPETSLSLLILMRKRGAQLLGGELGRLAAYLSITALNRFNRHVVEGYANPIEIQESKRILKESQRPRNEDLQPNEDGARLYKETNEQHEELQVADNKVRRRKWWSRVFSLFRMTRKRKASKKKK